jgi:hypothetical protein
MKCESLASIDIEISEICKNAGPSVKSTSRGIVIDLNQKKRTHMIQCVLVANHSQIKSMKVICIQET